MQRARHKQPLDHIAIHSQLRRLRLAGVKINQRILARKLRRSEVAVSYALQGKSAVLLGRIKTHLDALAKDDPA